MENNNPENYFHQESLAYLPAPKQKELHYLVNLIVEKVPVEMIILYGSYATGKAVEDRYQQDGITYEYQSDFDILLVVKNEHKLPKGFYQKIVDMAAKSGQCDTPVSMILHSVKYINKELESGNFFFVEIAKEQGKVLYDTKKYVLSQPKKLSPGQLQRKAQIYFDQWFKIADSFIIDFSNAFEREDYNKAAFELHQATEHLYNTVLLVFTDYKPKNHDLYVLRRRAIAAHKEFKNVFSLNTQEEKQQFKLLNEAYISARYKIGWTISKEDLQTLGGQVLELQRVAQKACKEQIHYLGQPKE